MNNVEPTAAAQKTNKDSPKKQFTYKNHKKSGESFYDKLKALMKPVSINQTEENNVIDLNTPSPDIFAEPLTPDFDKERAKQQFLENYK